jgi:hypothetical protein
LWANPEGLDHFFSKNQGARLSSSSQLNLDLLQDVLSVAGHHEAKSFMPDTVNSLNKALQEFNITYAEKS